MTYGNTFSDNVLASVFAFRAGLKVIYSLNIHITSVIFSSYLLDHILDLYIILYLSSNDEKIKSFLYNPCKSMFCATKFLSLIFCLFIDTYNNHADLGVLNMLGIIYYFIFLLFKSSEQLSYEMQNREMRNIDFFKTHYKQFIKPCCKTDIHFSSECVFCFDEMDNKLCQLNCKHVFHQHCFNDYIINCAKQNKKVSCVVCRKLIDN